MRKWQALSPKSSRDSEKAQKVYSHSIYALLQIGRPIIQRIELLPSEKLRVLVLNN